jgi:hypothetical protein
MNIHYQEKRTTKVQLRNVSLEDTKGGRYSALGSPKGTSESSFNPAGGSVGVSRTGATITPAEHGVVDVQLKMAFLVPQGTLAKQAVIDGLIFPLTP